MTSQAKAEIFKSNPKNALLSVKTNYPELTQ